MDKDLPPIAKDAEQLLRAILKATARFSRRHRYTLGSRLELGAYAIVRYINRAHRQHSQQGRWLSELKWEIDEIRVNLQLAKESEALRGFAEFEVLIRLAESLGRQAGGWLRQHQQHPRGQNSDRCDGQERAQTLSTRPASPAGAHP